MSKQLELHFDGRVPMDARADLLDREQNHPHGLHITPLSGRSFLIHARRSWKRDGFKRAIHRRIHEVNFNYYQRNGAHLPSFELDEHAPKTTASWSGAEIDFTEHGGLALGVANQLIAALGDYSYVAQIDIDHLDTVSMSSS